MSVAPIRRPPPALTTGPGLVFVVGAPASGTAAVHAGLTAHPSLSGAGTGDVLPALLVALPSVYRRHTAGGRLDWLVAQRVAYPELAQHVGAGVRHLHGGAADGRGWVDHAPVLGRMLDEVAVMFPDAAVVFVNRDGREVVAALAARYPDLGHTAACRVWQRYADAWRRSAATGLRLVEARFDRLLADPAAHLGRILAFLGTDPDDAAVRVVQDALAVEEPGRWEDWDAAARAEFVAVAGPELRALGFAADDAWVQA